jgi:hypothetical protein
MLKKNMKENNADLTTLDSVIKQIDANSFTQTLFVIYIKKQEHAGVKTVAKDIPKHVAMVEDATEESHVTTFISVIHVSAVMYSHRKSSTVSSALKTFVNIAQLRKLILRTFMKLNQ